MKPLFATTLTAARQARLGKASITAAFVTLRLHGRVIAATSCALRLDAPDGPIYLIPKADLRKERLSPGIAENVDGMPERVAIHARHVDAEAPRARGADRYPLM